MNLVEMLDRPIAFQRAFVGLGGGITGALMLSQALYWANRTDDADGWFYKSQEEWEEETGMTRREQETARRALAAIGVLEEVRQGLPARLYYRVNMARLGELLEGESRQSSMAESANQACANPPIRLGGKRQSFKGTETTTETTTERKAPECSPDSENLILEPEQPQGRKGSKKGNCKITFREFDDALREDEDPVSASVYALARSLGLPHEGPDGVWHGPQSDVDFIELAWRRFSLYYSPRTERSAAMLGAAGQGAAKRYADWRAHFRNAVEGCWGNLWAEGREGEVYLTQTGKQLAVAVGLRERAAA